ncbi:MAG TPA: hypothetical protein VF816_06405 [Rhodocyclaceae bacterium]
MPIVTARCSVAGATPIGRSRLATSWSLTQDLVGAAGVVLVGLLLFRPAAGLAVLWNVLIPIAPALLVVAPGLWRNICPMATVSLLPQRLGWSRRHVVTPRSADLLMVAGVAALLIVVPLRHLSLDLDGPLSAAMLLVAAGIAFGTGFIFEARGGWCASLCPIHPVERLYGFAPLKTFANRRCDGCRKCAIPCPDSTRSMTPLVCASSFGRRLGHALVGGFVGFVWGWNQVPDMPGAVGVPDALFAYAWPFAGAALSLASYALARRLLCRGKPDEARLARLYATAAVCAYYWYRLPALVGFGVFPETGLLCDLSATLPDWTPQALHTASTSLLLWFLLVRTAPASSWMKRPSKTA